MAPITQKIAGEKKNHNSKICWASISKAIENGLVQLNQKVDASPTLLWIKGDPVHKALTKSCSGKANKHNLTPQANCF